VATVCHYFLSGDSVMYWRVFSIVASVRAVYWLWESVGDVLIWRWILRKDLAGNISAYFDEKKFPPRQFAHDGIRSYLSRITREREVPREVLDAALGCQFLVENAESFVGSSLAARIIDAAERALDAYSPRKLAPVWRDGA
jgi:hypothetical protein